MGLIEASHEASGKIYGSSRVWLDLLEVGERISLDRVARIMQANKIRAQRGTDKLTHVRRQLPNGSIIDSISAIVTLKIY